MAISIGLSGCSKFLDTPPDQRTELDAVDKIAELLTSAYPAANYIPFFEAASDNAGDKGTGRTEGDIMNYNPWIYRDVDSRDMDSPSHYWYGAYKAISVANHALRAIEKMNKPKETASLKGEALVARAYAHHMLCIAFAANYDPNTAATTPGIPYVTEPEDEVLKKYDRKTLQYAYDQIEKDLLEGLPLLDNSRYKAPKFHFTNTSAHAFATRFFLFKKDYKRAAEHAEAALGRDIANYIRPINSPAYRTMEYNTRQQWYSSSEHPFNLLLAESPSTWGRNYPFNRFGLTYPIYYELVLRGNISTGQMTYGFFGGNALVIHIPKFREQFVTANVNASFGIPYNQIPLFTGDELLLNWVEALARLQKFDSAIELLNTFISKKVIYNTEVREYVPAVHNLNVTKINNYYGNQNLEENIIRTALHFKRVEFLFEGLRWMDILRHRITVRHMLYDGSEEYILGPNSNLRMFQIPDEAVMSGVERNPR